ncbi:hypothetical protein EJ06DRAFT_331335 [Trichodelitschia bisporula]|uniref:Uncharacterized protein n=1 Tax=Trichodelitschia bisporula TaxID=703511 RepID=A0A6G1I1S3_9PEZI|nr:hypothetical protein EJ06DRAFT_331335 [Trichodelitschia bisporula]
MPAPSSKSMKKCNPLKSLLSVAATVAVCIGPFSSTEIRLVSARSTKPAEDSPRSGENLGVRAIVTLSCNCGLQLFWKFLSTTAAIIALAMLAQGWAPYVSHVRILPQTFHLEISGNDESYMYIVGVAHEYSELIDLAD